MTTQGSDSADLNAVSVEEQSDAAWPWLRAGLAIALCFHLLGNATLAGELGSVAGGVAAALVLVFWRHRWPIAVLAVVACALYWHEAPIVGNHLLLLAAIAVAVAVESFAGRGRSSALAAARVAVVVFYGFAAFAKLNEGFFDPDTSCAPFYLSESARSLHLPNPASTAAAGWVVILLTVAIEASIPILLVVRRTRTWGVVVSLVFHTAVALDRTHQFFDFSAVLSAVFVTFLPAQVLADAGRRLARVTRPVLVRAGAPAAAVLAGLVAARSADRSDHRIGLDVGWAAWQLIVVVIGLALGAALLTGRAARPAAVSLRPRASLVVVALVAVNGVLPYLEVKTAVGWNMYANLRTVDGDSNHFVVRATLPLTGPQDDLVAVVSTDDPYLRAYADRGYVLAVRTVRAYLQERSEGIDAVLDVGGERVVVRAGEPIPDRLGPPVPEWVRRLFVLRSVPAGGNVPCQDSFLAAT